VKKAADRPVFRNPARIAVSTIVRCGEQMHRIVLTKSGRLVLVNHPNLKAERTMIALGGEPCRCLKVLKAWRSLSEEAVDTLPKSLHAVWRLRVKNRKMRMTRVCNMLDPLIESCLKERIYRRIARLAMISMLSISTNQPLTVESSDNGEDYHVVAPAFAILVSPQEKTRITKTWMKRGYNYVNTVLCLHPSWYYRVYRRGLAVIDRHFIIDVLGEDECGIRILAIFKDRKGNIFDRTALIRVDANGRAHLWKWLS